MSDTGDILALVFGISLVVTLYITLLFSLNHESVSNKALDNMCVTLYNNIEATYYDEFGPQDQITCRVNNTVQIIGEKVALNG